MNDDASMLRAFIAGLLVVVAGCDAGSATIASPTDSTSTAPAATTSPRASASHSAIPAFGEFAVVRAVGSELRAAPRRDAEVLTYPWADAGTVAELPVTGLRGEVVMVLATRETAGERWAQIAVTIPNHFFETVRVGWLAIGPDSDPVLEPFDREQCPAVRDGYPDEIPYAHALISLACFAGEEVSIEGRLDAPVLGRTCPVALGLECRWADLKSVRGLPLFVLQGADVAWPEDGSQVTVVGHFDDPSSEGCADASGSPLARTEAVLRCRTSFVADSVVSPPRPRGTLADERPAVTYLGSETYADGAWTRHRLRVENVQDFPDDLFVASPELPPCGGFEAAARTWVRVHDSAGHELALACTPGTAEELLGALSFVHPTEEDPPTGIYVELTDRLEAKTYRSDVIDIDR